MDEDRNRAAIADFRMTAAMADKTGLLEKAEDAMRGMLMLSGTGDKPVFVGIPPRWDDNPTSSVEFTWTMARLKYMVTLCKAFLVTRERRYLDKVEADIRNWLEKEPAPPVPADYESACYYHCVHHWRMLELGLRMEYTFPTLLSVLDEYGQDRGLPGRLRQSVAEHAERISAGSHLLWPERDHNHYTEEVNGLLSAAAMIPEHPLAESWVKQAMEGLEIACAKQLSEDGSQTEGAAEYHTAVVISFLHSIFFAWQCEKKFSEAFVTRVRRALDFSVHTVSPDGNILPFGDTDQFLYTPFVAAALGFLMLDDRAPMATLRRLKDRDFIIRQLFDWFPWGFPGIDKLLKTITSPLSKEELVLPTFTWQRQMDQYIVRSGWDPDAVCLFFSCHSPIHTGSNHAHIDQLGIIFGAYGKILLQDPGRFTYDECEDRRLYKSSQFHNMPTVDGEDAFEYRKTFAYGPQRKGAVTRIFETERLRGACGCHDNYAPVTLQRCVGLLDEKILVIADTFEHVRGREMKVFFHLNSIHVTAHGSTVTTEDPDANVVISSAPISGEIGVEVLDGRISDVFYHDYPSKRAAYTRRGERDTETLVFAVIPSAPGERHSLGKLSFDGRIIGLDMDGEKYRIAFENGAFRLD